LEDGRCLGTLRGHEGRVLAVAIDEAQARVVSGGEDGTVRDWGLASHEAVRVYRAHGQPVTAVALTPDGSRIVSASADRTVRVFETDGERLFALSRLAGAVSALAVAAFLHGLGGSGSVVAIGLALTLVFSFFFTSVAANAIATTARNPVSGMTMLTIIISSLVLLEFGLSGRTGMFFVMAIAGMVCTALSVSGQTITDLKTGYWLGNTPATQERVKFLGVIAASVAAGLTIVLLARTFQFGEAAPGDARAVLASPQASIMKALVEGFMSHQPVAYLLFGVGAVSAGIWSISMITAITAPTPKSR
jgi:hypothetical protein